MDHSKLVKNIATQLELTFKDAKWEKRFQLEHHGYFLADSKDSLERELLFNRTVSLRDARQKS